VILKISVLLFTCEDALESLSVEVWFMYRCVCQQVESS